EQLLSFHKHRDIINNMHYKNRGGGTGFSATSWYNAKGFNIDFTAGWCDYHD
ncbi:27960_t:CDS:1, partial [Dentiscutata erythropus]